MTLKEAIASAQQTLVDLGLTGLKVGSSEHRADLRLWTLEYTGSGQVYRVSLDEEDRQVYAVTSSRLSGALTGGTPPRLGLAVSKEQAQVVCASYARRLAKGVAFKIVKVDVPYAQWPGRRGTLSRIVKVEFAPMLNGFAVQGYGCTIELDRSDGSLLSYAGKWNLPPHDPAPSKPMTIDQVRSVAAAHVKSKRTMLAMPVERKMAYIETPNHRLRVAWIIEYSRSKFVVDASNGKVIYFEAYK